VEVAGPVDILHLQNSFLGGQYCGWICAVTCVTTRACIHCCLDGFWVAVACHQQEYVELHFYHVLPSSDIYWYADDLEDGSGLLRELFVYRQCTFLFARVINFLKQYMTSAGNS